MAAAQLLLVPSGHPNNPFEERPSTRQILLETSRPLQTAFSPSAGGVNNDKGFLLPSNDWSAKDDWKRLTNQCSSAQKSSTFRHFSLLAQGFDPSVCLLRAPPRPGNAMHVRVTLGEYSRGTSSGASPEHRCSHLSQQFLNSG